MSEIDPKDLYLENYPPRAKGGQHVGSIPVGIKITHIPTGISVVYDEERSQYKNKARALEILEKKLSEEENIK